MSIIKNKIKRGDMVRVITGVDKGMDGKVLKVDTKKNRLIVEGINLRKHHERMGGPDQQGGIIEKEGYIHASNVMYLHNGKPVKIGYAVEEKEVDGKSVRIKRRMAKVSKDDYVQID